MVDHPCVLRKDMGAIATDGLRKLGPHALTRWPFLLALDVRENVATPGAPLTDWTVTSSSFVGRCSSTASVTVAASSDPTNSLSLEPHW